MFPTSGPKMVAAPLSLCMHFREGKKGTEGLLPGLERLCQKPPLCAYVVLARTVLYGHCYLQTLGNHFYDLQPRESPHRLTYCFVLTMTDLQTLMFIY